MAEQKSPKDAQVIASILKDLGITDYEPRVVHQLLEFTNRYVSGVLDDARAISLHAKKKSIESDDIKLAITMQLDRQMFTTPPARDVIMEMARARNENPLPSVKPHNGIRLPPDRYCTTSANFKLKYKLTETNGSKFVLTNSSALRSSGLGSMRRANNMSSIGRAQAGVSQSSPKVPMIKLSNSQSIPKPKIQVSAGDSIDEGSPTVHVKVIDSTEIKSEPMEID